MEALLQQLQDFSAPFAFVDMDALDSNIAAVNQRLKGKKVRVATKSIRCRAVMDYLIDKLENLNGWMVFSPHEALWLSQLGYKDILLGYPTMDALGIKSIFTNGFSENVTFMVDAKEQVELLNQLAAEQEVSARLCVDVDMSSDFNLLPNIGLHFGVYRSPIISVQHLEKLLNATEKMTNVRYIGLMGYEAQIAGVGDKLPTEKLKSAVVRWLKSRSVKELRLRRKACVDLMENRFGALEFVNGGGTGSIETTRDEQQVSEITVGSGFFQSHLFDNYCGFSHQAAAFFACQVVRVPKAGMVTVMGGGYLASGSADKYRLPMPVYPKGLQLTQNEGAGEVQTPLLLPKNSSLSIRDLVVFRHAKAGEVCERFTSLHLVRTNGEQIKTVPTYRGEGQCFL